MLRRCLGLRCTFEEVPGKGYLVRLTERFDDPAVTESAERNLAVERHLGTDLFAGYGWPEVPCRVPQFDVSELQFIKPGGGPT